MIEKIKKALKHNSFLTTAVIIVLVAGVWLVGCQSTTQSPLNSTERVTRSELNAEVKIFKIKVDNAIKDLDQQDLFKQELANIGLAVAQGGSVSPIGAGVSLLSILGIGFMGDNVVKNKEIKRKSDENKALKILVDTFTKDKEPGDVS